LKGLESNKSLAISIFVISFSRFICGQNLMAEAPLASLTYAVKKFKTAHLVKKEEK
jgi:hypothetical protein